MSQSLVYQVTLINQYWVRLHGDFRRDEESTMFLASSTKTKNSFVSIAGFVDLLLQSRQCLFEVRSVPDLALYRNQSCSKNPPITSAIFNFLWSQMVGMIFVRKIIHLATYLRFDQFHHILAEFIISYKSIVHTLEVLFFLHFFLSSWAM